MVLSTILNSFCFPWILIDQNATLLANGDGALFKNQDAEVDKIISQSVAISEGGWSVCENGYAIYKFTSELFYPASVIVHSLKIDGISKFKGKSKNLSLNLSRSDFNNYILNFNKGLSAFDDQYKILIRQNIHEIRSINAALYNTALELQDKIDSDRFMASDLNGALSKNVVSLSELLRGRIDFMDFIANPNILEGHNNRIQIYKKFDKIQRCFRVTARKRAIDIDIEGNSSAAIYGPPIFDLIPYLLLENAIKYSPDNHKIKIIFEESIDTTQCVISSFGPKIEQSEINNIFLPGIRGENAQKSNKDGSGFGLYVLKKIVVDIFHGQILVRSEVTSQNIKNVPYSAISFTVRIPLKKTA